MKPKLPQIDVLAFSPHPDDVEIFCGGIIIKLAQAGYKTAIVTLSLGELSSRGDLETRAKEAEAAAKILGVSYRENLNLPDGELGSNYSSTANQQLSTVVSAIRRIRPEIVLSPYRASRHPDHAGASDLIDKAIFFAALEKFEPSPKLASFTTKQVIYYQERFQFNPSFITDISSVAETKQEAIRCYRSQFGLDPDPEAPATLLSSEHSLYSIDARDRYYGALLGVTHAEPFLIRNSLSISDPVKHFRDNPNNQPFYFLEK